MKTVLSIMCITMLLGCQSKSINMDDAESIKIVIIQREHPQNAIVIVDVEQIKNLTTIIENAKREPVKFLPDYRLEVNFKDSTVVLSVRNNFLNNEGITYRMKKNLGKRIEAIIKDQ